MNKNAFVEMESWRRKAHEYHKAKYGMRCYYCDTPLLDKTRIEEYADWIEPTFSWEHCGCGKHDLVNVPCVREGYWRARPGYSWPQFDHLIPRSKGGSDNPVNVALACGRCNGKKRARTATEFLEWMEVNQW